MKSAKLDGGSKCVHLGVAGVGEWGWGGYQSNQLELNIRAGNLNPVSQRIGHLAIMANTLH